MGKGSSRLKFYREPGGRKEGKSIVKELMKSTTKDQRFYGMIGTRKFITDRFALAFVNNKEYTMFKEKGATKIESSKEDIMVNYKDTIPTGNKMVKATDSLHKNVVDLEIPKTKEYLDRYKDFTKADESTYGSIDLYAKLQKRYVDMFGEGIDLRVDPKGVNYAFPATGYTTAIYVFRGKKQIGAIMPLDRRH